MQNRFHNWSKSSGKLPIQSNSGTELSLANLVDVTGEVEHLVGEAPLIRDRSALPLIRLALTLPTITSVSALPFLRFSVFKSKKSISLSQKQRQPSRPLG